MLGNVPCCMRDLHTRIENRQPCQRCTPIFVFCTHQSPSPHPPDTPSPQHVSTVVPNRESKRQKVRLAWPLQDRFGSCSSLNASELFQLHGLDCMTPSPACAAPAGPKCAAGHAAVPPATLLLFASPLCRSSAMYVC